MTSTPTPEPAKITCPDCGGHPSEPKLRTEGGSLSCSFCNRTLTFNFMRDNEPEHRACACRASRNARCQTCGGDGEIDVRPAPSTPGEGTGRPGGWVEGIGWVALFHDLPEGTRFLSHSASEPPITSIVGVMCSPDDWENYPVIVTRWADGTTPAPPASPVPPTRPGADAVIRALIAACPSYGRGEGDTFRIEESAVVRLAREFLAAAPPTPPPQADGTGQALKSMAIELAVERRRASLATVALLNACRDGWADGDSAAAKYLAEAELAAAPPSTPADPRPTDLTGSEA